jgi:Fe-S-cluster containining protein
MHFLPDQNFDCENCTKCCRGWRIRVDEASRQALERVAGKASLKVHDGKTFTQKNADGSCVFLQSARCSVHEAKPAGCRQFPFRATRTPDGIFVGVSFYCSAVQRNSGRPLHEHQAELAAVIQELPLIGADPLVVHDQGRLHWDGYKVLDEFLSANTGPAALGQALWALCRLRGVAGCEEMRELLAQSVEATTPPEEPFFAAEPHFATALLQKAAPGARLRCEPLASSAALERYARALVFRKFLITRRPVLHNMAALYLLPRLFGWLVALLGVEEALDRCEYSIFTHATSCDAIFAEAAGEFFWAAS